MKIVIDSPMLSPYQAERKTGDRNKANFIRHISAYVGDRIVYDISTSAFLYPLFRFKYNYEGHSNQFQVVVTDNKGKEVSRSKKITSSLSKNSILPSKTANIESIDYWIKSPKIWEMITTEEVIKKLYGSRKINTNGINVKATSYPLKVNITSKLALKSIAILSNDTSSYRKNKIPALRAIISIQKNTVVDYNLDFFLVGECCEPIPFTIIAEGEDGQLYKNVQQDFYQGCSDCDQQ